MQEAAFGDASAVRRTVRFKGETGKFYRVSIMDPSSWSAETHYIGGYLCCLQAAGGQCPACDKGMKKSQRFGNNIALYQLDMNGMPIMPVQFQITFWPFGPDVWTRMCNLFGRLKAGNPQLQHPQFERDLLMECQEARFQKFQIDLSEDPPLWRQDQALYNAVQMAYNTKKVNIQSELGKTVTAQDMLRAMNDPANAERPRDGAEAPGGRGRGQRGAGGFGQQAPVPTDPAAVFGGAGAAAAAMMPGGFAAAPMMAAPAPMAPPMAAPVAPMAAPMVAPQAAFAIPVQAPRPATPEIEFGGGPLAAPVASQPAFLPPTDGHATAGEALITAPREAGDGMMKIQALEQEQTQVAQQMAVLPHPGAAPAPMALPVPAPAPLMPPVQAQGGMGGGLPTAPAPQPRPAGGHSAEFQALTAKIKARRGASA